MDHLKHVIVDFCPKPSIGSWFCANRFNTFEDINTKSYKKFWIFVNKNRFKVWLIQNLNFILLSI